MSERHLASTFTISFSFLRQPAKTMPRKERAKKFTVRRASPEELDSAYAIVREYYEAASVVAQDSKEEFARFYFSTASGLWLALVNRHPIGCIALRSLPGILAAGEVKRLYVRPEQRGCGIAAALYAALEKYAVQNSYQWLYLDTAADMTAAQRFYATLGYQPCDRYNDNPQAAIFMRKKLTSSVRE